MFFVHIYGVLLFLAVCIDEFRNLMEVLRTPAFASQMLLHVVPLAIPTCCGRFGILRRIWLPYREPRRPVRVGVSCLMSA